MATLSSASKMYEHRLNTPDSSAIISNALQLLRPHIPVSLPLYRRIQGGRFFDASVLLSNIHLNLKDSNTLTGDADQPWLIAFIDRSCRPETEVYLFSSWEVQTAPTTPDQHDAIDELIYDLLARMRDLGLPPSIHDQPPPAEVDGTNTVKDSVGLSRSDYDSHASDPSIMLWGSVHERTYPILQRLGYLPSRFKTSVMPNHCFIWTVDTLHPYDEDSLPQALSWGILQREHFALVRSRTQIPRQDCTLAVLPNLAIFSSTTSEPVAWAFVGLDGSLTTLHVESDYRGQGLAKMLTVKLFKENMGRFWEEGIERLAHGYVIEGNKSSEGMCRSLGGTAEWMVYWLRVDLGAVR
jgi:ribosomal protein S18 acetylase RimI-like enzyme